VHSVELLQVFRARFDKVRRVCSNWTFKLSLARFTEKKLLTCQNVSTGRLLRFQPCPNQYDEKSLRPGPRPGPGGIEVYGNGLNMIGKPWKTNHDG
jgi:hypothetical protein